MTGFRGEALLVAGILLCAGIAGAHADAPLAPGDLVPAALAVDAQPNGGSSDGNGVMEAGETAIVAPSWRNTTAAPISTTSTASPFVGPGAGLYTVPDASASYVVPAGQAASCTDTGNCLALGVIAANPRPAAHWDATFGETTSNGSAKTWTFHVGESYGDVARTSVFYRFAETLLHHGISGGCPAGAFCPVAPMTREWMAPFVLGSKDGRYFIPPACELGGEMFADVPATSPNCRWVEELARRGVVTGCGGGNYCPTLGVSREQMAVFVLVTLEGPSYSPPSCVAGAERFADVPASSPFCRWVEELARRNVVAGCGGGNYCPAFGISREQMAVFLSVTFGLSLYGPAPHMYLVNTTNDVNDGACTPAHCSLREAIYAANTTANPGVREEIHFRIPGPGVQTITPFGALFAITDAVVIDGYTQPGSAPNTRAFGGLDSMLRIELNLASAGPLTVSTSNALLRGLAVNRSSGHGIAIGAGNAIEGCFIGTDAAGTARLDNFRTGVYVGVGQNGSRIGGTMPVQRNLVSGNFDSGIAIESASNTLVQGNLIGTDRSGTARVGNREGVRVFAVTHLSFANDNVIGGLELDAGNVISGNAIGVRTTGTISASVGIVERTRIQANLIGFVATGGTPLTNETGLSIEQDGSWDTQIGGLSPGAPAGNAIAAAVNGIRFGQGINGGPRRTHIQGNLIRSSVYGIGGIPGPGGDVSRNVIGPNTSSGIHLVGGSIAIRQNSIFGNGGLGIDLVPPGMPPGVTPNDPGDGDMGPNNLQNYPVLTAAVVSGGTTTVSGTLDSTPNATFIVELFQSPSAHPSGHGEGAIYRGAANVTTNAIGSASINTVLPVAIPPGNVISATATDAAGNTSEFSAAVAVTQ